MPQITIDNMHHFSCKKLFFFAKKHEKKVISPIYKTTQIRNGKLKIHHIYTGNVKPKIVKTPIVEEGGEFLQAGFSDYQSQNEKWT